MFSMDISMNGSNTITDFDTRNVSSFSNFMIALKQSLVFPVEFTTDCFEYVDDEGDTILVRTEDEFQTFLHYAVNYSQTVLDKRKLVTIGPVLRRKSKIVPLKLEREAEEMAIEENHNNVDECLLNCRSNRAAPSTSHCQSALDFRGITGEDVRPVALLGTGHSGSVYKALDIRNDRFVAVKNIALDVSPEVKEQILSEMNILYKCSSPFIIDFYGACFADNLISIYTEFMDAGSVDQLLRCLAKMPEPVLCSTAVAIVSGLVYLWEMKIMHRDIKPSNVLLNSNGDVKLCDFGVSVQLESSIAKSYVGTSVYMAPERLLGQDYTIHSDVWSLGLSLTEMALGRFPYDQDGAKCPMALIGHIVDQDPPSLKDAGEFSKDLCEFISNCLRKDPKLRPTFHELKRHPLITSNEPFDRAVIANWVSKLPLTTT